MRYSTLGFCTALIVLITAVISLLNGIKNTAEIKSMNLRITTVENQIIINKKGGDGGPVSINSSITGGQGPMTISGGPGGAVR